MTMARDPATTVLVVEDEESFVEALTVGLKREGVRVEVARDGVEAMDRFDAVHPDLVLLDVMLPTVSGIEVCRQIRTHSRVPIIMVSAKRHEVFVRNKPVKLPLKEFELLEALLNNAGRVLTRDTLIDRVWGSAYVGDTKTLDVHIKRLRAKVEADPGSPVSIVTIRGLGYKFEPPARAAAGA